MNKKNYALSALSVASLLLAGCFGGSSDSGSDNQAPTNQAARSQAEITVENAPKIVSEIVKVMFSDDDYFEDFDLDDFIDVVLSEELGIELEANPVTENIKHECSNSGSLNASIAYGGYSSMHEDINLVFNSCESELFSANGSYSIVEQFTGTKYTYKNITNNLKVEYPLGGKIKIENGSRTADCNVTETADDCVFSSPSYETKNGEGFYRTYSSKLETWSNYDAKPGDVDEEEIISLILDASRLDGSLQINTPNKLEYKDYWNNFSSTILPIAGKLKVVGANNANILITFSEAGAKVQVDTNNDKKYECNNNDVTLLQIENSSWVCSK